MKKIFIFLFSFLIATNYIYGDRITTLKNEIVIGKIIDEDEKSIWIRLKNGNVRTINKIDISKFNGKEIVNHEQFKVFVETKYYFFTGYTDFLYGRFPIEINYYLNSYLSTGLSITYENTDLRIIKKTDQYYYGYNINLPLYFYFNRRRYNSMVPGLNTAIEFRSYYDKTGNNALALYPQLMLGYLFLYDNNLVLKFFLGIEYGFKVKETGMGFNNLNSIGLAFNGSFGYGF